MIDPNLMLMYFACYFPSIVLILAKTSLLSTIATIGHVTRVKTSPLILTAGEGAHDMTARSVVYVRKPK